ncbi:MAG: glycoside hydrolase family 9 protein [Bacteroidota bacterium]|nr:glycoside hydrolase family 9 protein [Bacteroidota bacterium]
MKQWYWLLAFICNAVVAQESSWIRINQLGYPTRGSKVAVWGSKVNATITDFEVVDAKTDKVVYRYTAGRAFGAYGPFMQTYRLKFTGFTRAGTYYLRVGKTQSPVFKIDDDVYKGTADFCLRYMRQQRSGFNPFLKDSCHTHDGYTLYGPMKDSTHIDATGGWHDASDYLQYTTTSANATWHLLSAYRDFPGVFSDTKQANGLEGKNGMADVLDEAKWGLDWLLKMNPKDDWMFNQLGDDRDHMGMRMPKEDSFYGKGFERPLYFVNGKPQQRGKFLNATTGGASTAGKFASTFALASQVFRSTYPGDNELSDMFLRKAEAAYRYGNHMPGVAQTASVRSPYIYAEGNWVDDMELAAAELAYAGRGNFKSHADLLQQGFAFAKQEPITPWLGKDTAHHYQWYPFVNAGHNQLIRTAVIAEDPGKITDTLKFFYKQGIQKVWDKAKNNAFYRGVPFIWCSNNLTTSFGIQCLWYAQLTGDQQFVELEQANIDWLFGCNPWGTSMVYGLPANGDTPVDPHSAFTHIGNYPIDGGLVDGPVYTAIYKNLIGIQLKDPDEYADFQSDLAVYHDDYGDYSTNEPTMDGTASLIYLLAAKESAYNARPASRWYAAPPLGQGPVFSQGAIIRGNTSKKEVALVFTGDEFGEGLPFIMNTLNKAAVTASFYFTGRFYRNPDFQPAIRKLYAQKHLLGPHSDQHLLYNDWNNRDKILVSRDSLEEDYRNSLKVMQQLGISQLAGKQLFIPPYEWWNREIAGWFSTQNVQLFSFTPGTTSNADYTWPEMGKAYKSSEEILTAIKQFAEKPDGLNGVILLLHVGTDPRRKDKLYDHLDELIVYLKKQGYAFKRMDALLR